MTRPDQAFVDANTNPSMVAFIANILLGGLLIAGLSLLAFAFLGTFR